MEEQEEDFIVLTDAERKALYFILDKFLLSQPIKNVGKRISYRYMRQKSIWINQKNFLDKNPYIKSIKSLYEKKAIQPHSILGYTIRIKEDYVEQIYNLLDNDDKELVIQLAGVWIRTS